MNYLMILKLATLIEQVLAEAQIGNSRNTQHTRRNNELIQQPTTSRLPQRYFKTWHTLLNKLDRGVTNIARIMRPGAT